MKENNSDSKKTDWKFVIGTVILVAVLLLMGGSFWGVVARQARIDHERELEKERLERENSIRAIALQTGEFLKERIFLDMDGHRVFQAPVPAEGIYNRNGVLIKGDVLEYGDEVRIYGGEIEQGEGLPQYRGMTRMERLGRASLEEASAYQEEADIILRGEEAA